MKKFLIIGVIFTLLVSCNQKDNSQFVESGNFENSTEEFKAESEIEKRIADTDLNDKLDIMNSLYFTKEDGSSLEVKAFLDKSKAILKIEEKFSNGENGGFGTNIFYIHHGKKYASRELFEESVNNTVNFVERISYYDSKEKVTNTKVRKAQYEEDLISKLFEVVSLNDCSIKRAMNAINQEGEFETNFQGFILSRNDKFITVGESKENGYVSALMLQYNNSTSIKLFKNQTKYLGKKLNIEFQKMIDESGFEYQILLNLSEG